MYRPIYSDKSLVELQKQAPQQWAEIADWRDRFHTQNTAPKLKGAAARDTPAWWLFSEAANRSAWAKMKDNCVVNLVRPTSFQHNVSAELVGKLFPDYSNQKVWAWHQNSMIKGGLSDAVVLPDRKVGK